MRCIENCDEVRKGDTGRVTKVSQYVSTKPTLHNVKQEETHLRTNIPLWPGLTLFHYFMIKNNTKFDIRKDVIPNLMIYLYGCTFVLPEWLYITNMLNKKKTNTLFKVHTFTLHTVISSF